MQIAALFKFRNALCNQSPDLCNDFRCEQWYQWFTLSLHVFFSPPSQFKLDFSNIQATNLVFLIFFFSNHEHELLMYWIIICQEFGLTQNKHALPACSNQYKKRKTEKLCQTETKGPIWLSKLVTNITSLTGLYRLVTSSQLSTVRMCNTWIEWMVSCNLNFHLLSNINCFCETLSVYSAQECSAHNCTNVNAFIEL